VLFLDDGRDDVGWSFALRLALAWLSGAGVLPAPAPEDADWLRLGPTTIRPFSGDDGGYVGQDDAGYQFMVDFRNAARGFDQFRLGPLLRGEIDPARIRDRVVIVGVTAEPADFFHVPSRPALVGKTWSGVERRHPRRRAARTLHQSADPLRAGESSRSRCPLRAECCSCCSPPRSAARSRLGSSGAWCRAARRGRSGLIFAAGQRDPFRAGAVAGPERWLASFGLLLAWSSSQERTQRAALMRLFSRHVSAEVADEIWRQRKLFLGASGRPPSHRLVATVLFVDMKGYTASAEKLDPETLMSWVNEFMEPMAELVVRHGGVVDDYFGDGIKANFGVPFARDSGEEIAADARRAAAARSR
jgi:adenylate cyclase